MNAPSISRRIIYGLGGCVGSILGGFIGTIGTSFTVALAVTKVASDDGRTPAEVLGFKSKEEYDVAIEKWLDFSSKGSAATGGLIGLYFGGVQKFSVLRFLAVTGGGFTGGLAFTIVSFVFTNTIPGVNEDEKSKK